MPVAALARGVGEPWFIARDNRYSYWSYDVDGGNAWLVATIGDGTVRGAQIVAKNGRTATLDDGRGVALGQPAHPITALAGAKRTSYPYTDAGSLIVTIDDGSEKRLYGTDRSGNVDRIGKTTGPTGLPSLIRWYTNSGFAPNRAVPMSAYHSGGEDAYAATADLRSMACRSQGWQRVSQARVTYGGAPLDRVEMRCGRTGYKRPFYFAATVSDPHPLAGDPVGLAVYQSALSAASTTTAPAASTPIAHAPTGGARPALAGASPAPGSIWFTTPSGRCGQACGDALFAYVDDPQHPFTSIQVYLATVGPDGTVYTGSQNGAAARGAVGAAAGGGAAAGSGAPQYCVWGGGIGKCDFAGGNGQWCYIGFAVSGSGTTQFGPICLIGTGDPSDMPHGPHCNGASGGVGQPVDVVSGRLWRQDGDAQLSGPLGLGFMHRYDSGRASVAADVGYGWRHAYSASSSTSPTWRPGW